MAMRQFPSPVSADDLESVPDDGNRYEVIDGELFVTPAPSLLHQRTLIQFTMILVPHACELGLEMLFAPVDVRASSTTQVEPDILVLPLRYPGRGGTRWEVMSQLLLAVEILSPSTARTDRIRKRDLYLREGVPEYWIVDADARAVEIWQPAATHGRVERKALTWQPLRDREPLLIDLEALFSRTHLEM